MQSFAPGGWVPRVRHSDDTQPTMPASPLSDSTSVTPSGSTSGTPRMSPKLFHSQSCPAVPEDAPSCIHLGSEEVIYSKTNVCVHSRAEGTSSSSLHSETHVLGNLSVRCRGRSILSVGSSLILHWVPNVHMTGSSSLSTSPLPANVSRFTVDLSEMRSVRVFFTDAARTCGDLVIASHHQQFRVLHFHSGGLAGLIRALDDWPMCCELPSKLTSPPKNGRPESCLYGICRALLVGHESHPDEGKYCALTTDAWYGFMDTDGRIKDEELVRKIVFFGGVTPEARALVWPFLLGYFPFRSTRQERAAIADDYQRRYGRLKKQREVMDSVERQMFWNKVQCTVEKDVVRTDRREQYFAGEGNPNIIALKEVLLCYALHNPDIGYVQGMSDMLAPLLATMDNEVSAFACFVGVMQHSVLMSGGPTAMDSQLTLLRELLRMLMPGTYSFLARQVSGLEMLFCHRWLLLCFKREFKHSEAIRVWEGIWAAQPYVPFSAFICMAILAVYGTEIVKRNLQADDILLYFSRLSRHMSAEVVLHQARAFLFRLANSDTVPCAIAALLPVPDFGCREMGGVRTKPHYSCDECCGRSGERCSRRHSISA